MFKKQQRWIALLLTVTFVWLLQVSAMPLAAVDKTEQVSSANVEQEPGVFEQTGYEWGRVMPKTFPLLLIGAAVAIALLIVLIHGIDLDDAPRDRMRTSDADRGRI